MKHWIIILFLVLLQSCSTSTTTNKHHSSVYCVTCVRDNNGHIQRSEIAKKAFMKQSGYPNGRQGYIVDHIVPLYKGGQDIPSNMQWLSIEQHKAKHKDL